MPSSRSFMMALKGKKVKHEVKAGIQILYSDRIVCTLQYNIAGEFTLNVLYFRL